MFTLIYLIALAVILLVYIITCIAVLANKDVKKLLINIIIKMKRNN